MVVLHSGVWGCGQPVEDRLLREVDTWVKDMGHNYPLLVVGDFNIELLDSQALMEWAAGDFPHDLHVARAVKCGTLPGPTTDHRRIDYVWVNAPPREAVTDFSVEDIFATHRSLRIRLHLAAFTQQKLMRYKPAPLDTTTRISLSAEPSFREVGRTHPGGGKRNFRRCTTCSD